MIHQVHPTQDFEKLRQLVDLQMLLLDIAAQQNSVDEGEIAVGLQAVYGPNAQFAARWMADKSSSILGNLNTFAGSADVQTKTGFVTSLKEDVALLFAPRAARLNIAFSTISDSDSWGKGRIAAGAFCLHFYTLWGTTYKAQPPGFPGYLFPDGSVNSAFDRWQFIDSFTSTNATLYLCAICDAAAYRTQVDSRAYTSIEHFFPKSIYRHLAIHPYNLIPICTFCNSNKNDDDLMDLCSNQAGIAELILPYRGNEISQTAYVEVSDRPRTESRTYHPLQIKIKPAAHVAANQALTNAFAHFEKVYDIEKRWNNELEQIGEQTFRRLQQFLLADVQMGNDLTDVDFVRERVGILMALTSQENLGRDPFAFAGMWLLKYFEDSIRQDGKRSQVYLSLKDWAANHSANWEHLRQHAEDIRRRVP